MRVWPITRPFDKKEKTKDDNEKNSKHPACYGTGNISLLSGCAGKDPAIGEDGRIQIKVQYISGRMNMDLESVLEDKFPDVDIITDKLYDLSQESFTNNFYLSAISDCVNSDGGLYYLPGPVYIYGIIYDKTAFKELGLSVPHSYSEFVQLLDDVKARNIMGEEPDENDPEKTVPVVVRPFVPTLKWPDMWTIFFDTYNYDKALRGTISKAPDILNIVK